MLKIVLKRAAYIIAAIWIFGGAMVYYWRFTTQFFEVHGSKIGQLKDQFINWVQSF